MRVIDSHTHLGVSRLSESVYTEEMPAVDGVHPRPTRRGTRQVRVAS